MQIKISNHQIQEQVLVLQNYNEDTNQNFELSYQDNSIEIIGNNWEGVGDQSTIEILEDFNINNNDIKSSEKQAKQRQRDLPLQSKQNKTVIKLGLTSGGQNFLSKVKTNTIKLFQKQSIISEESASQCQTSLEPSSFKNISPLKQENSTTDLNINPHQQHSSFNKSYFNQSIRQINCSNISGTSDKNKEPSYNGQATANVYGMTCSTAEVTHLQTQQTQNMSIVNKKVIKDYQPSFNASTTMLKESLSCKSDGMSNQDVNSKSGNIYLPFYRRNMNKSQSQFTNNFNLTKQSNSPLRVYGSISQASNLNQISNQTIQKTKNIQILNYYSNQIPEKQVQPSKRPQSQSQYDSNSLLSTTIKTQQNSDTNNSQSNSIKSNPVKLMILSKGQIKLDKAIQSQGKENREIKRVINKSSIKIANKGGDSPFSKQKSPIKIQIKKSQVIDRQNLKETIIQQQQKNMMQTQNILEEEELLMKQMERDIKCNEKFSEKTLISPNAVIYRPKSTQPLHRKSFSFNSPHMLGGFLKRFNQSYSRKCSEGKGVNDSSIMNENDSSFMRLEDQSFVITNRYAT